MIYVAWGVLYEGSTDKQYYDVLIPRLIEALLLQHGLTKFVVPETPAYHLRRADPLAVAQEICENEEAFHLAFIHADTGGRNQAKRNLQSGPDIAMKAQELCGFDFRRCVLVAPRHEMEAWALSDSGAVCEVLGYAGRPEDIALPLNPNEAEALPDPKQCLAQAMRQVRGRRSSLPIHLILPVIAQKQDFDVMSGCQSFVRFKDHLLSALQTLDGVRPHL